MDIYDLSKIVTEDDLLRHRLTMRARTIELIRQMVEVRRREWHFLVTKCYLLYDERVTDEERIGIAREFAGVVEKLVRIRQDISNTIKLVRDLDNDTYENMGPKPEH